MVVRLPRITSRLGVSELDDLAEDHLQTLCELGVAEDVDLDSKGESSYKPTGSDACDEVAKDVTASRTHAAG
jgi:hypothetical protein